MIRKDKLKTGGKRKKGREREEGRKGKLPLFSDVFSGYFPRTHGRQTV